MTFPKISFSSAFVFTAFLLNSAFDSCAAQSFATQLNANEHKHPQLHVQNGPVLPNGDSFGNSRALNAFHPGASAASLDVDKPSNYGSVAPFSRANASKFTDAENFDFKKRTEAKNKLDDDDIPTSKSKNTLSQKIEKRVFANRFQTLVRKTRATAAHGVHAHTEDIHEHEFGPKYAKCSFIDNIIYAMSKKGKRTVGIRGDVLIQQENAQSPVNISGTIHGLYAGVHGFHLTEFGDVSDYCFGIGRHYNPFNKAHGAPYDKERHVGDLGNILADGKGVANVHIVDKVVTLFDRYSVIGRALVVHAIADDFARGGNELSLLNGNPGPHIACCTIAIAMDDTLVEKPDGGQAQNRPDSFGFA